MGRQSLSPLRLSFNPASLSILGRSQPSGLSGQQELRMPMGLALGCSPSGGTVTNHFSRAQSLRTIHSFHKNQITPSGHR